MNARTFKSYAEFLALKGSVPSQERGRGCEILGKNRIVSLHAPLLNYSCNRLLTLFQKAVWAASLPLEQGQSAVTTGCSWVLSPKIWGAGSPSPSPLRKAEHHCHKRYLAFDHLYSRLIMPFRWISVMKYIQFYFFFLKDT